MYTRLHWDIRGCDLLKARYDKQLSVKRAYSYDLGEW